MTQEDKQLLFKDLCARLPYYYTMLQWKGEDYNMIDIGFGRVTLLKPLMSMTSGSPLIEEVKPYLRPWSSMTREEGDELFQLMGNGCDSQRVDFYNSHYLDYRGLIPKELALEAPEGMYKIN